jgi:hypothetical protein
MNRPSFVSLCLLVSALTGCHADKVGTTYGGTTAPQSTDAAGPPPQYAPHGAQPGNDGSGQDHGYANDVAEAEMAPMSDMPTAGAAGPSRAWREESRAQERQAKRRPGLGTEYGERHYSAVREVGFQRRGAHPEHVFQLFYDDAEGVRSAAQRIGWPQPEWSQAMVDDSGLSVRILDARGRTMRGAKVGEKTYALGQLGQRYTIGVYNDTGARQEVVASVDGLDVITGESARFSQRGYVVEPYTSVQIDGWRTSESDVAAFRFSAIEHSYAGRTGRARNVGVIGVAFFSEAPRYSPPPPAYDPWRDHADPFPGN